MPNSVLTIAPLLIVFDEPVLRLENVDLARRRGLGHLHTRGRERVRRDHIEGEAHRRHEQVDGVRLRDAGLGGHVQLERADRVRCRDDHDLRARQEQEAGGADGEDERREQEDRGNERPASLWRPAADLGHRGAMLGRRRQDRHCQGRAVVVGRRRADAGACPARRGAGRFISRGGPGSARLRLRRWRRRRGRLEHGTETCVGRPADAASARAEASFVMTSIRLPRASASRARTRKLMRDVARREPSGRTSAIRSSSRARIRVAADVIWPSRRRDHVGGDRMSTAHRPSGAPAAYGSRLATSPQLPAARPRGRPARGKRIEIIYERRHRPRVATAAGLPVAPVSWPSFEGRPARRHRRVAAGRADAARRDRTARDRSTGRTRGPRAGRRRQPDPGSAVAIAGRARARCPGRTGRPPATGPPFRDLRVRAGPAPSASAASSP